MDYLHRDENGVKMMRPFLCLLFFCLSAAQGQEIIRAESGQNVTLPCRASKSKSLTGVEWRRDDLKPEDILLYRDEQFVSENQHPSFKNRVDLQDRQMKDGDVSLILKHVTINDNGTYVCRALTPGRNRGKRAAETVNIITLRVDPPGQPGGSVGLAAGVSVFAVVLLVAAAAVGFVIYRRRTRDQSPASSQPAPVELQLLEHV